MAVVNVKDIPTSQNSLGQFFTPPSVVDLCLANTKFETDIIIEPSCGNGAFLDKINHEVIALEADKNVIKNDNVQVMNFYDYNPTLTKDVTFIGNPPIRTPAISVTDDKTYGRRDVVKGLMNKYDITGMREEAVFFVVKSVDLILENNIRGHLYYILPKSIFHNNSKSYKSFATFLKKYVKLVNVMDLPSDFANVSTDLCYVHMSVGYDVDGIDGFYGVNEDMITFHQIFKKTYLGSVPCESVLMSIRGEDVEHFKARLHKLATNNFKQDQLLDFLNFNGEVHLVALKKKDPKKIEVVWNYVNEIRNLISAGEFLKDEYYKPIQHRHEQRFYFRHNTLKKASFLYQLNPNPCPSFYFPGNPVTKCLDYHGFTAYDCNRNCSPSANRTVPIQGINNNLVKNFKTYWDKNACLPYTFIFNYLSFILMSDWYKEMKSKYQRFYFGIPAEFDKRFLDIAHEKLTGDLI